LGRTRYRVGNGLITGRVDNGSDVPILGRVCFERRGAHRGPCGNGEGGRVGRSTASWAARRKEKAEEGGLGWLQGELGFGPSLSRIEKFLFSNLFIICKLI
jgi:hypothetical protein